MILCDGIWPASITLGLKHRVQTNTEYGDGHWGGGVRGGGGVRLPTYDYFCSGKYLPKISCNI